MHVMKLLVLLLSAYSITAEHVDCRSLPVTTCTDHPSCSQCINSITRKSFCMSHHEAAKHQGGVIECFDVPPTPPGPGSCTGQLEANCKPPCVWCKGRFPGLSGCFDKVLHTAMLWYFLLSQSCTHARGRPRCCRPWRTTVERLRWCRQLMHSRVLPRPNNMICCLLLPCATTKVLGSKPERNGAHMQSHSVVALASLCTATEHAPMHVLQSQRHLPAPARSE